jgi:GH24 family phage-related lysozyme (muramidase)
MAKTGISQEERQLIKLVEQMHVTDEFKTTWLERIRNGDFSEDLAEEIRAQLSQPNEDEQVRGLRTRQMVELATLVRRWRLSSQSRHFTKK